MVVLAVTRSGTGQASSMASATSTPRAPNFQVRWPGRVSLRQASRRLSSPCRHSGRSAMRHWRSKGSHRLALTRSSAAIDSGIRTAPAPSNSATSTATGSPPSSKGTAKAWSRRTSSCSMAACAATSVAACTDGEAFSAQAASELTHQCGRPPRNSNSIRLNGVRGCGCSSRAQTAVRLIHSCAADRARRCDATWPCRSSRRVARCARSSCGAASANCSQPSASITCCTVRSLCGGAKATPTAPGWPSGICSAVASSRSPPGCVGRSTWNGAPGCTSERCFCQRAASSGSDSGNGRQWRGSLPWRATARQATPAAASWLRQVSSASTSSGSSAFAASITASCTAGAPAATESTERCSGSASPPSGTGTSDGVGAVSVAGCGRLIATGPAPDRGRARVAAPAPRAREAGRARPCRCRTAGRRTTSDGSS